MTSKTLIITIGDKQIFIDRKDLKGIDLFNLRITANGYAAIGDKLLHRIIMNPPENMQIDHVNKNTLDNRRCNLRVCTVSQNQMNRGKQKNNSTGYKGVNQDKRCKRKKYRTRITKDKKTYYLGNFEKPSEAGQAYKKAVKQHHGEFARVNDP
jgi:hypothetical protein